MEEEWALPAPIRLKIAQMAHLMEVEELAGFVYYVFPRDKFAPYVHDIIQRGQERNRVPVQCNCDSCTRIAGMME